ncbi:Uu.00g043960.m01.CDS01 [Anthostomella pinea]|uniref:Uu.00g043960.m01.CDS01 n=1 Tax=Anthostomella pinea TaxID=933095 RepID=A0AAI8YEE4_9PEZI|nr:Uu.00g043960.m01.CDS01 [Anthostomella pinea]
MSDRDVTLSSCSFDSRSTTDSPYGYRPSASGNAIFAIIYVLALVGCLAYSIPGRKWPAFGIPICVACVFEAVGFGIRLGSSFDPWDVRLFAVSTAFTAVAPAFVAAGLYSTLNKTVSILGVEHSLINPARYPWLIGIDATGVVIQLVGIIVTFADVSTATGLGPNTKKGTPIIAAGTGLQALSLICFHVLFAVVAFQAAVAHRQFGYTTFHSQHGFVTLTRKFKVFLAMLIVSSICLLARAVFQTTLLGAGFGSNIARIEALFLAFNGFLVAEPIIGLVIAHPASYLQDGVKQKRRNRSAQISQMVAAPRDGHSKRSRSTQYFARLQEAFSLAPYPLRLRRLLEIYKDQFQCLEVITPRISLVSQTEMTASSLHL